MLKTISFQKISSMVILCLLAFCLIFSSLLCGSPLNNNTTIVNILLNITAILSIIINNFIYGKKLKFAKYDILILLISVMYLIPIIFHTYSSISDTFQYFLRYFSIFCIYIILKNLNLTPKVISILLHSIILGAFFIIVLGIDDMSTHFFENLHLLLNSYSSSFASDIRLDSVFEYPNAFAAFINFSCFFTISFFLKTKNKYIKSFYAGMINIEIIAIILSGSRLNIALFLFVLFIFILLLHKKYDTLELIELFFIVFFGSLFYCTNYLTFINYHQYCFVWGGLLLSFFVAYLFSLFITPINKKVFSFVSIFSIKKWFLFIASICIIFFILLLILLQIPDTLTIFDTEGSKNITIKQLNNIQSNTEYLFEFNIESFSGGSTRENNNYSITIFELNDNLENLQTHKINFNEFSGWKTYQLITTPDTSIIKITCKATVINENTRLTFYDFYVNHEKIFLNYKFLPKDLVFRIFNILSGDNSLKERFLFIQDGIKIANLHLFSGSGANGWKYHFPEIQTEKYYTTEVHSYPIQLLIEVGIVGILLYLSILISIFMILYKNLKKKKKDPIFIALFCSMFFLFLHSCIDFDMSFFCVLLQFYTVIIIFFIAYHDGSTFSFQKKRYFITICILLLLVLLYALRLNIGFSLSKTLIKDSSLSTLTVSQKVLRLDPFNKNARLLLMESLSSADLIKELELFLKYEPNYSDIDYLKLRYVSNLLQILNETNINTILNKINQISYTHSFFTQTAVKQETRTILALIQEKISLYPNSGLDSLYQTYLEFFNY